MTANFPELLLVSIIIVFFIFIIIYVKINGKKLEKMERQNKNKDKI